MISSAICLSSGGTYAEANAHERDKSKVRLYCNGLFLLVLRVQWATMKWLLMRSWLASYYSSQKGSAKEAIRNSLTIN